jgi:hypothetical protein
MILTSVCFPDKTISPTDTNRKYIFLWKIKDFRKYKIEYKESNKKSCVV